MSNYRRPRVASATVFFTVCLAQRGGRLLIDEIDILREAVLVTRHRRPFGIDAWVVLPDHMHAIWTLPQDDANYSDRWGAIKAWFSKHVRLKDTMGCKPTLQPSEAEKLRASRTISKCAKQDGGIWQRRFWDHHIRNDADYTAHLQYCWTNPVRHGLVARPADWPYSSLHRDIRLGRVEPEFNRHMQNTDAA